MRGSAAVSAGGSDELERLKTIATTPRRCGSSTSDDDPADMLAQLRALDGDAGAAVAGYLDLVGCRLLDGFDIWGPTRSRCPTRCSARSSRRRRRRSPGADVDELTRASAQGPGGEPARVRRTARRGAAHLPAARRARGVQRHLGVGTDAPCHARRRPATRRPRSHRRARAHRRCRPRRDARDARRDGRTVGRGARGARASTGPPTPRRTRRRSWATPPPPPPDPSGLPPGVARIMRAVGIALDSLFGSSEAEHEHDKLRGLAASPGVYEGPARLSPVRPSSAASSRGTCSSPRRRPRRSTSCCRCSGRSSPTTAACSRTRRSSRGSTAFRAWSEHGREPSASPTGTGARRRRRR